MVDSVEEQWDANAEAFSNLISDQGTPHHRQILNPCVQSLLGDVAGKDLLDAGCGEGYLSRYYASLGAHVTGIDFSRKLVTMASDKTPQALDITYAVGNICTLDSLADDSFDIILCNLVLLNVACMKEAIFEFKRVLRPGGALVFSVVHPAFDFYGPGSWEMGERDSTTNRRRGLFFKVDDYSAEKPYERYWRTRDGERFPQPITFYHRTISSYITALVEAGLSIQALEEPLPTTDDEFFEREQRIPFFMVFKARKPWVYSTNNITRSAWEAVSVRYE
jgi:2-polyprenyl-3-methyl-5-hydroxy-6-metoxy-1,4-benzoquinol methylase